MVGSSVASVLISATPLFSPPPLDSPPSLTQRYISVLPTTPPLSSITNPALQLCSPHLIFILPHHKPAATPLFTPPSLHPPPPQTQCYTSVLRTSSSLSSTTNPPLDFCSPHLIFILLHHRHIATPLYSPPYLHPLPPHKPTATPLQSQLHLHPPPPQTMLHLCSPHNIFTLLHHKYTASL
ncbi:unnamed protein product [Arctogadus glacialis]